MLQKGTSGKCKLNASHLDRLVDCVASADAANDGFPAAKLPGTVCIPGAFFAVQCRTAFEEFVCAPATACDVVRLAVNNGPVAGVVTAFVVNKHLEKVQPIAKVVDHDKQSRAVKATTSVGRMVKINNF